MKFVYPNFLYIGMMKAGSSWLFEALREHPDVYIPVAKDLQFFDHYYKHGIKWYCSYFSKGKDKKAVGELSHDYILSEQTAKRIKKYIPGVKLICCLREPGDLFVSAYKWHKMHSAEANRGFEYYADLLSNQGHFDYYKNLRTYYKYFNKEQIKVVFYEELKDDPKKFIKNIYSFLGVDTDYVPSILYRRVNVASKPRCKLVTRLAWSIAKLLRRVGLTSVVGVVKRNSLFQVLFYEKGKKDKEKISEELVEKICNRCRKDYSKLEQLIGKSLPALWK